MTRAAGPLGRRIGVDGHGSLTGANPINPRIVLSAVALRTVDGADQQQRLDGSPLLDWADGRTLGDQAALTALWERELAAARAAVGLGATAWTVTATTTWRMLIDASPEATPHGTGMSLHPVLGHPVLRSTAVRGAVRAVDPDGAEHLFGSAADGDAGGPGSVSVGDAHPMEPVRVVWDTVTPHHGDYYAGKGWAAEWDEPVPVSRLAIDAGQTFRLVVTSPVASDAERAARLVGAAMGEGLGAVSSNGYGYCTTTLEQVQP